MLTNAYSQHSDAELYARYAEPQAPTGHYAKLQMRVPRVPALSNMNQRRAAFLNAGAYKATCDNRPPKLPLETIPMRTPLSGQLRLPL